MRLMPIVYCLKFETPPTLRARFSYLLPQKQGSPVILPGIRFTAMYVSLEIYDRTK
jgi:hypothetical protein